MKIIGSAIIITVIILISLEMKLMPYVQRVHVPILNVSTSPADIVVVYLIKDSQGNDKIMNNLKFGSIRKTLFSGTFEHPLSLGSPPEYIFSKVLFSAFVGLDPDRYPTNISITISRNVTLEKLQYVLRYFNKGLSKKNIYVIEIPNVFGGESVVEGNSLLVNETIELFSETRTTILRVTEDRNDPSLRLSMWGPGVANLVGSRMWKPEDVVVLISGLLNVPIPGNSLGKTSQDLFDLPEASLAYIEAQNSLHLATACLSTTDNYRSFGPFKYMRQSFMSRCDFKKYMGEIKSNLRKGNYELVRMMTKLVQERSLECIHHYKSLCITCIVVFATTITFLWIYILIISFIVLGEITEYYNRTVMIFTIALHVIFYLLIVVCVYTVFILSWPYRYIVYLSLIVILLWMALIQSSYIFNFVPMHVKPYITWLLMFYFAVNEIVYWSWEKELMLFALLVPYVTAEWVYKHYEPDGKHLSVAILLNLTFLFLCFLNLMEEELLQIDEHVQDMVSLSLWLLAGFPLVYRYVSNPFVLSPVLLSQAIILYLLAIAVFQPSGISHYTTALSWWLLTSPLVVFCLTDNNSVSVLLIGYATSVPVLLLSKGYESVAILVLFVHMYCWYMMETVPKTDSIRKIARGISLYLYIFICHLFTRGEVQARRFLAEPYDNWLLVQFLKVYKELLPSLLMCFLWAVLHRAQKQSFGKSVNYVLMLCVSVSFRHFISVIMDEAKMEALLNNYIFHLNCLLSLFITNALFKDFKVPFGYFIPIQNNKKLFVVTKFIRHKIQKKSIKL